MPTAETPPTDAEKNPQPEEDRQKELEMEQNKSRLKQTALALIKSGQLKETFGELLKKSGRWSKIPAKLLIRFALGLVVSLLGAALGLPLLAMGGVLWILARFLIHSGSMVKGFGKIQRRAGETMLQAADKISQVGAGLSGALTKLIPALPTSPLAAMVEDKVNAVKKGLVWGFSAVAILIVGTIGMGLMIAVICQNNPIKCFITRVAL